MVTNDIRIGIITALPEEFVAVKVLLDSPFPYSPNSNHVQAGDQYFIGTISAMDGGAHKIALCLLPNIGNNLASIIATKMQITFPSIDNIIISGIAGGVPSKVHLGDVVVSTEGVFQYDYGKQTDN